MGKMYVVHTLSAGPDGVDIRVLTDQGGFALGMYPIEMFEIVDGSISSGWGVGADAEGRVEMAPAAWIDTLLQEGHIEDGVEGLSGQEVRAEIQRAEDEGW